ncbi:MAG: D-alanyl-D-alanine carboxypeptidase [Firmicutes bacterium]|nr:D-alanyl-D-alanine carboxypeptidase [Bacillota bacterium]
MFWHALLLAAALACTAAGPAAAQTPPSSQAGEPTTTAEAAVLVDAAQGQVLYAKEPHKRLPMASVTKLMTMLLAVEAVEQNRVAMNETVVASENAWKMGGSQIFLAPGEKMSFRDMLTAVAVGSANDASVAVAEHLAGSEEAFVQLMNDRARDLGMKDTRFANCTGLPAEGHYTSAYDLALLMREALNHPLFMELSAIKEYDLRGGKFKLWNTNKLLWFYEGTDAGKTGWTNEARYCLASSARRGNLRLIAVVLGTPEPKSHFRESIKLYNYGFARYRALELAARDTVVAEVPVVKGTADVVAVVPARPVTVVLPRGQDKGVSSRVELPSRVTAPLAAGQRVGSYRVLKDGQEVLAVDLVARDGVERVSLPLAVRKVVRKVYGP